MGTETVIIKDEFDAEVEKIQNKTDLVASSQITFKTENVKTECMEGDGEWNEQDSNHNDNRYNTILEENKMDISSFSTYENFIDGKAMKARFFTSLSETQIQTSQVCHICQKSFDNKANLNRHQLIHSRIKHTCPICQRTFASSETLEKHNKKHILKNKTSHQCDMCQKQYKSHSYLMLHKKTHSTIKPYTCNKCDLSFTTKSSLNRHQRKNTCKKQLKLPLFCQFCNKEFKERYLLKSHLQIHQTSRPFQCDICGLDFKHKSAIARHIQWHNGVRPIRCKFCPKTFTHLGLLKPHLRVHTGEKPYQCSICSKHFSHKHNMERHKINHGRIKRLVCDICNKRFPRESRLIYHMRSHLNVKHFKCGVCDRLFSHKQNILRHYERKHPGKSWIGKETDAKVALKVWDEVIGTFRPHFDMYQRPEEILG